MILIEQSISVQFNMRTSTAIKKKCLVTTLHYYMWMSLLFVLPTLLLLEEIYSTHCTLDLLLVQSNLFLLAESLLCCVLPLGVLCLPVV